MFKKKYLTLLMVLILGLALVVTGCGDNDISENSANDDYPERAMEVTVGWGAGGGTDTFTRAITQPASEILGESMPVQNMEGSSGAIAGDHITQQPADGYTIWGMGVNYSINAALGRTPHMPEAYTPIVRIQHDTAFIQVEKDSPFQTIEELMDYMEENPGEVRIGGTGAASFDEIVLALWADETDLEFTYVPYEGAGDMHAALLGGHVDVMFEEMGPISALYADGAVRPLMAFSEERSEELSDVPTSVELGWDITLGNWRGIMVKDGTPSDIAEKLEAAFTEAKDAESYQKIHKESFLHLRPGYLPSEDFEVFLDEEIELYREALEMLGHI